MLSFTEENYLKALLQLTVFTADQEEVGVNQLAKTLDVKPATVSDMVRKLKEKELIHYEKYGKISLTKEGRHEGMMVVRRHRLWETFLYDKLNFTWDEVHEVAEELEHIHSKKLMNRLFDFLGQPEFDPHGDAIPNEQGEIRIPVRKTLDEIDEGKTCRLIAVKDNSSEFLRYVDRMQMKIGDEFKVVKRDSFDQLLTINYKGETIIVSPKFTENVFVVTV